MKGLLKSNLFAVYSNGKVFSIFMLILGIFVVAVISQPLLIGYALLSTVGFSVSAAASIKREFVSKWGKYKLTLPVTRANIVKSLYISQLICLSLGLLYAGMAVSLSWAFHGCPFDRRIDVVSIFALGISVSVFTVAFFFPLLYLGGEERSDAFIAISLLCGVGVVLGMISALNHYFAPGVRTIVLSAAILILCSFLMLALSYPLTVGVYQKKEY